MRPLELTLEGFRSYQQRVTFDWRGRRLVAVVGPIGSGKSSLLDAIAFALYGRTPVLSAENAPLIRHGCDQARVELGFVVDGQTWWAVRVLRRKGANKHTLSRLDGETVVETLDKEREVTARVEQLLGLDFGAFCRSVFLAQNRFAEFLEASTRERDEVLKGLFGFDRLDDMRARARQRAQTAEAEVRGLEVRLAELEDDKQRLARTRLALAAAEVRQAELEAGAETMARLHEQRQQAREAQAAAEARRGELARLEKQLPPAADVSAALEGLAAATAEREAAQEAWTEARRQRTAARELKASLEREVGSEADLARAEARLDALQQAQTRLQQLQDLTERLHAAVTEARQQAHDGHQRAQAAEHKAQQAAAEVTTQEDAERQAEAAVLQARQTLDAAHRAEMACTLRHRLEPGEPCPVCEREVPVEVLRQLQSEAPQGIAQTDEPRQASTVRHAEDELKTAEEALARQRLHSRQHQQAAADAQREAELARQSAATARRDVESTELRRQEASRDAEVAAEECAREERLLTEQLGDGDPTLQLRDARQRVAAAARQLHDAESAEEGAAAAVETASLRREEARSQRDEVARRLATLSGQLAREPAGHDLLTGEDPAEEQSAGSPLRSLDRQLRERLQQARQAARTDAETAAERLDNLTTERRRQLADLQLAADADFDAALQQARGDVVRQRTSAEDLERRLQRARELREQLRQVRARHDLYRQLAEDLQPSRFLTYLLEEERVALARVASARLEMLTDGRYRFTDDGEMHIVDLAYAEAERDARTLSGGETFLASLALALALAEKVAGRGGRLDAFFLDEGFGSLDPEHLDLALEGIERLASEGGNSDAPDRLVTLVSHVPDIRQRVDDLIVLDKDPASGATIVRQGASRPGFAAVQRAAKPQEATQTQEPKADTSKLGQLEIF